MPTFDFQCRKCSTIFEFSRPYGSKKHPACPKCGSAKTEKLLTPPAIQFKGKGFYKTDSRKHAAAPPKKKETKKEETTPKKDASKTEKKTEASNDGPPRTESFSQ